MGVECKVAAPSLIPSQPGARVETDKRDCKRLARLFRAGELTYVRTTGREQEAMRDLCRAREDVVCDLRRTHLGVTA